MFITEKNRLANKLTASLLISAGLFTCSTAFAQSADRETWYKWNNGEGHTQYTQTPPDADTPFEEIDAAQIGIQHMAVDSQSVQLQSAQNNYAYHSQPESDSSQAPRPEPGSNFSAVPENARIIPHKHHYGSSEYKVSPVSAAIEQSQAD
jgi:hypothetical protein